MKLFNLFRKKKPPITIVEEQNTQPPIPVVQKAERAAQPIENPVKVEKPVQKPIEPAVKFHDITLSKEQIDAFNLIENANKNYFITGRAGTGKSTVLKYFLENTKKKKVAVVAPTGVAAINVGGQTIHSFFGMNIFLQDTHDNAFIYVKDEKKDILKGLDVLVIDEISMVRVDIMDMIDAKLKFARESKAPFGGCQVIAFGDLFQIPPVVKTGEERQFLEKRYGTVLFFGAPSVKETFSTIELKQVVRQRDSFFISVLDDVRTGSISTETLNTVNARCVRQNISDDMLRLVLRNDDARKINAQKLAAINNKEYVYDAEYGGTSVPTENDVLCDFKLRLKVGAKVMMLTNDLRGRYVNGSFGVISDLDDEDNIIEVTVGPHKITLEKFTWEKIAYTKKADGLGKEVVGWVRQYPVRLAYAITIHKSQGQTYDKVAIDYSCNAFSVGQTYVALSRCRTLDGIYLTRPLQRKDIMVSSEAKRYMENKTEPQKPITPPATKPVYKFMDDDDLPF